MLSLAFKSNANCEEARIVAARCLAKSCRELKLRYRFGTQRIEHSSFTLSVHQLQLQLRHGKIVRVAHFEDNLGLNRVTKLTFYQTNSEGNGLRASKEKRAKGTTTSSGVRPHAHRSYPRFV